MADTYVDLALASGSNNGTSWANAYHTTTPIQNGLTGAGAGGRCFVKTDSSGTNKDTAATARTLTAPSTVGNVTKLIGVKSTTTNEPPVDSDLCIRGTDNLPEFEATASSYIRFANELVIYGIKFTATAQLQIWALYTSVFATACEFDCSADILLSYSTGKGIFNFTDCEIIFGSAGSNIAVYYTNEFRMVGGEITGTVPTSLIYALGGTADFYGVNLSSLSGTTLVTLATASYSAHRRFVNCSFPASYTVSTGTQGSLEAAVIEIIGCNNESSLGAGESIRDYHREDYTGSIDHEFTAIRTGGADDGADGGFSFALTPVIDRTLECAHGIKTGWIEGWIDGDGSTAFDVTIFIANSGGADYNTDDVILELLSPSSAGNAQHDFTFVGDIINGSSTPITDDTVSSWGTGGNNPQKLTVSITPDFSGPIYGRVHFMKRFASSPETLYVDPKLDIS